MPHQEIKPVAPQKENKPIIEKPVQTKPSQQRPIPQRLNEVPKNNNQSPDKKMAPQERPVLKQSLPTKRKPKMAD